MAVPAPWSRPEPFGAWVRLDDATLIAVDAGLAARLGVPHGRAAGVTRPLELHVAVTSRCPAPCQGCYLDARPDGAEPPFEALRARLAEARDAGVSTIAFGGGEPLTRRDLGLLAAEARRLGLVPVMTTSGIGLTETRVEELRAFAQINVSHDGIGEAYEAVRGFDGQAHADRAIRLLSAAGIPVGANLVLTRASFEALGPTCAHVADLGAREVQLLRYKPAGRAVGEGYADRRLSPEQVERLWPAIRRIVDDRRLGVRVDCAMVPLLSKGLLGSVARPAETLAALGVFGCEAARHLGGQRVDGTVAPCSFFTLAPATLRRGAEGVAGPLAERWERDGDLVALRAYHASPPEPCASCEMLEVCRGGCQVVSRNAGGLGPDPECPRVRAYDGAP
jgi:radical SAM protein with 4Fe4S-binding SPASM domain